MQVPESIFRELLVLFGALQIDGVFEILACSPNFQRDGIVSARRPCVLVRARSRQELRDEVRTHGGRGQGQPRRGARTEAGAVSDGLLRCLLNFNEEGRPPHGNVCLCKGAPGTRRCILRAGLGAKKREAKQQRMNYLGSF